jgi:3-oxoacyl-[acyl-carrier protein] reductase
MRKYLITGSGSDLSKELIKEIAQPDDFFLLQSFKDSENVISICDEMGLNYKYFEVDLSSEEETDKFAEKLKGDNITHFVHFPALKVINTKFKNFDTDRFILDLNVQLLSRIKISNAVLSDMSKNRFGRIVFISTSYILANPPKNTAAYTMAKSALTALSKNLAIEYAGRGITVNCVSPSMVETKFLNETSHLIVEAAAASHPMKRNATPKDIAPAIAFLLSEKARFITGVNLPITGGSIIV